jgi:hypothetical protein
MKPVSFPPHALLILEERLRERQEEGSLPSQADVTELALQILVLAQVAPAAPLMLDTSFLAPCTVVRRTKA